MLEVCTHGFEDSWVLESSCWAYQGFGTALSRGATVDGIHPALPMMMNIP